MQMGIWELGAAVEVTWGELERVGRSYIALVFTKSDFKPCDAEYISYEDFEKSCMF